MTLTVGIPESTAFVEMDRVRFRQLIMNLLNNAVKYTYAGGEVKVECSLDDRSLEIMIIDTGIGIAPGDLPRIFDRFWRVDPVRSSTGRRPGAGLGLSIARWVAESHGGTLTARSRPGKGSAFTIRVPISASGS